MYMTSDDGDFFHRAGFVNETCGVYVFSEPDEYIEIHVNFMDVSCEKEGRIIVSNMLSRYQRYTLISPYLWMKKYRVRSIKEMKKYVGRYREKNSIMENIFRGIR